MSCIFVAYLFNYAFRTVCSTF